MTGIGMTTGDRRAIPRENSMETVIRDNRSANVAQIEGNWRG